MNKKRNNSKRKAFDDDEQDRSGVDSNWTREDLLKQEGIFFLKDIVSLLDLNPAEVKRKARELEGRGKSAWEAMGIRKIWSCWIVRMRVFAPFVKAW